MVPPSRVWRLRRGSFDDIGASLDLGIDALQGIDRVCLARCSFKEAHEAGISASASSIKAVSLCSSGKGVCRLFFRRGENMEVRKFSPRIDFFG